MATLTAHLCKTAGHDSLPFHPGCPICRERRLCGTLPSSQLAGRRMQAGILAIAFAAVQAPVALAADAGGPHVIAQGGSGDETDDGGGDDGGGPVEEAPPSEQGPEDVAPPPPPPPPAVPATPAPAAQGPAPPATVPPTQASPPSAAAAQPPPVVPAPPTPPTAAPALVPPQPKQDPAPEKQPAKPAATKPNTNAGSAPAGPSPSAVPPDVGTQAPAQAPTPVPSGGDPTPLKGSAYVVKRGDSLWSIAARLAGPKSGPATIARLVNELWQLNDRHIGTGDPDLIRPGQRVVLPQVDHR